jgi:hypothetical protein
VDSAQRRDFEVNLLLSGIFIGAAVSGFAGVFIESFSNFRYNTLKSKPNGENAQNANEKEETNESRRTETIEKGEEKKPQTVKEKLDCLLKRSKEGQRERKRENVLAKIDGL